MNLRMLSNVCKEYILIGDIKVYEILHKTNLFKF